MLKENSSSFIDHIISSQVILGAQTTFAVSFHESLTLTQGYSPCSQLCFWKARVLPSCFKPWYRSNPGAGDSPSERDPWEKAGGKERPVGTQRRDLTNPAISAFHRKCSVSLFSHILCQFRHHMRDREDELPGSCHGPSEELPCLPSSSTNTEFGVILSILTVDT